MATKTAVLSVRIVSDSKSAVKGLLDTAAAVSVLDAAAGRGRRAIFGIAKDVPKIAVAATAITSLAATAVSSVGSILSLAGGLASVSGAALLAPAAFLAGGVAMGAFAAIAMDAGTELGHLVPRIMEVQKAISGNFWSAANGPITELANTLLPTLNVAMANTGRIMGTIAANAANTLATALGPVLGTMLSNVNIGFHNAGKAVQPLIEGLVTLTNIGSTHLPGVGTAIANIGTAFNTWVEAAATTGKLNEWIETGLQGLADLGSVALSTVGIFASLTKAAQDAGGVGLGGLADGMARVNEAMAGPIFQGVLTTIFEGANQAVTNLTPGVIAVGDAFTTLDTTLATVMATAGETGASLLTGLGTALSDPIFQSGAVAAFEGIRDGVAELQPAFDALGPVVGTILETFGKLAENILPILSDAFVFVSPLIIEVAEGIGKLAENSTALNITLGIVAAGVTIHWAAMATAATVSSALMMAAWVRSIAGAAVSVVTHTISAAIIAAKWTWMGVKAMAAAARMALAWFVALGPIGWVTAAIIGIAILVIANWDKIKDWTIKAWTVVVIFVKTAWERLKGAVTTGIAAVRHYVSVGMEYVKFLIRSAFYRAVLFVVEAWGRIRSAVSNGVSNVIAWVRTLPGRIVAALSGMGSRLYSIGSDMMAGLKDGIKAWASNIIGSVKGIVSDAIGAAKNLLGIRSPSRVFRRIGQETGKGLVLGLNSMSSKVSAATADLIAIPSAMPIDARYDLKYQGRGTTQQVVIQNTVRVEGTVIDRLGTAEAIAKMLRDRDLMMGAKP